MPMEWPREQGRGGVEAGEATSSLERGAGVGLRFTRHFVPEGVNPYDEVEWDVRSAVIQGEGGETVFEQRDVEVPRPWSQLATNGSRPIAACSAACSAPGTRSKSIPLCCNASGVIVHITAVVSSVRVGMSSSTKSITSPSSRRRR